MGGYYVQYNLNLYTVNTVVIEIKKKHVPIQIVRKETSHNIILLSAE